MATDNDDWVQVRVEANTRELADALALELSSSGAVTFNRAKVFSAALKVGLRTIKENPQVLFAPIGRKRIS
jgi:hypothetical protein